MTDTYTIEKIEDIEKLLSHCARLLNSSQVSRDLIGPPADTYSYEVADVQRQIAELQRPAWKPAEGEVYPTGDIYYACHQSHHTVSKTARPQTLAMHGPDVRALRDGVEDIAEDLYASPEVTRETAGMLLKAFNEVVK